MNTFIFAFSLGFMAVMLWYKNTWSVPLLLFCVWVCYFAFLNMIGALS